MYMKEFQNKFGFGCMRLPMVDGEVDEAEFCRMVDAFLAAGFNYFDTAHVYLGGKSETALQTCLTSRYPRDAYVLTNKLSDSCFSSQEDIRPFLQSQLDACGVDFFDFYLMHAQNAENYVKYKSCRAYETALELKEEGKLHHLGISFHDSPEVLDRILTENPDVEAVQLQFNYLDYDDPNVQSRNCYDVCQKHGKPVIVMEPVKGGCLTELPPQAAQVLENLHHGSPASYALRFAAGFDGVAMVLSGMGSMAMMTDNVATMGHFAPLTPEELVAVAQVAGLLRRQDLIACTGCRYCVDGCPQQIAIPDIFAGVNTRRRFKIWQSESAYAKAVENGGRAGDCIRCGKCERACPQHLPIRNLLADAAKIFDKG